MTEMSTSGSADACVLRDDLMRRIRERAQSLYEQQEPRYETVEFQARVPYTVKETYTEPMMYYTTVLRDGKTFAEERFMDVIESRHVVYYRTELRTKRVPLAEFPVEHFLGEAREQILEETRRRFAAN